MKPYLDFYYYFLSERHYFECHEVMEEAWKERPIRSKQDIEVGLILLATSQYHLRRRNTKGAATCLKKSIAILTQHEAVLPEIGLEKSIIAQLKAASTDDYHPINLPLTEHCLQQLKERYPHFSVRTDAAPEWIHYHKTRDRSDIIALRQLMRDKNPVRYPPHQSKQRDDN